jgi:hypothetical protein
MTRMMLVELMTPRHVWAKAINIASYISNRIFLHPLLNLTKWVFKNK